MSLINICFEKENNFIHHKFLQSQVTKPSQEIQNRCCHMLTSAESANRHEITTVMNRQ